MRTFLGILTVALAALPYAAIAHDDAEAELEVPRPIEVEIEFEDNGDGSVHVTGEAEGLTFGDTYVSLIYDDGSEATGPDACEPSRPPSFPMFLGTWVVDEDGDGTLGPLDHPVPLSDIGTVSIRNPDINGGFGPHAVLACGEVEDD